MRPSVAGFGSGGTLSADSTLALFVPHGHAARAGLHARGDSLAHCALRAGLDQARMAAFHEVAVVPTRGAGHAHGEVDGAKYREHRIWKVGRSNSSSQVLKHSSMVRQTGRPTTESRIMNSTKTKRWIQRTLLAAAALTGMTFDASCSAAWKIFRSEASQDIGTGVKSILDGIVDGLVAVVDPSDEQSQNAASSSSSSN